MDRREELTVCLQLQLSQPQPAEQLHPQELYRWPHLRHDSLQVGEEVFRTQV